MVYKWSKLRHMPNLCSVDIFKQICALPMTPIPAYKMRTMSIAYWIILGNDVSRILAESLKTCRNPPRARGGKRIGTLASKDGFLVHWSYFVKIELFTLQLFINVHLLISLLCLGLCCVFFDFHIFILFYVTRYSTAFCCIWFLLDECIYFN